MKFFSKIFFILIKIIDYIFKIFKKKSFKFNLYSILSESFYSKLRIKEKDILFYTPSLISKRRIETLFSKEPDTIRWIENFDDKEQIFGILVPILEYILYMQHHFQKTLK